jgi:hypothetical protein
MVGRSCPHCQGILIPYDGSIIVRTFDKKTPNMPIAKKVDGKIPSVTIKFIVGI